MEDKSSALRAGYFGYGQSSQNHCGSMPQRASHLRRIESCQVEKTARDFPVPSCSAALADCGREPRRRKKAPRSFRNIHCRRLGAWRSLKSSLFKQIPRPIAPYRRPVAKHPIFFRRERCRLQSARRDAFLVLFAALQKEPAPEAEQSF